MRSSLRGAVLLLCLVMLPWAGRAEPVLARAQVEEALAVVRADPDLPGSHKERTLRFKKTDADAPEPKPSPRAPWLVDLARWIADGGRVLVWVLGALAVAALAVKLRHWIQVRAPAWARPGSTVLPSHVRDLDIRPESLPEQIGLAARELWERGEQRPALSLLYRGALSRLVHGHGVPIRAASTEGECVMLAAQRLPPTPSAYVGQLVQAWQLAVYGARLPESAQVLTLCAEFDSQLRATPAAMSQGIG